MLSFDRFSKNVRRSFCDKVRSRCRDEIVFLSFNRPIFSRKIRNKRQILHISMVPAFPQLDVATKHKLFNAFVFIVFSSSYIITITRYAILHFLRLKIYFSDESHQDNMSVCFIPPYTPLLRI